MAYVLGVDAGNTKTVALVARHDGVVLGAGRAGCGDIYDGTGVYGDRSPAAVAAAALGAVEAAIRTALRATGVEAEQLAAGGFNMAGADWPEDFAFLQAAMERHGFGRRIVIVHDSIGPLRAGAPDGCGVAVVCGTGAAIGARAPDGRIWHTSHWQEGQGSHDLARKALRAVYRAELGIDPPTALSARALELFERRTVEEVLHLFTAREATPPRGVDRLAPVLLEEARRGDDAALRLVRDHGYGLGDYALAAARRVGIEGTPFTLVLAGSVLRESPSPLADAIVARVQATSPDAHAVRGRLEPVAGAVLLALDEAGIAVDEELLHRLAGTLPPSAFFATQASAVQSEP